MSRYQIVGLDGSNPLGFLAALGLLRVVPGVKLGFCEDGAFQAFVEGLDDPTSDIASAIVTDAERAASKGAAWRLTYTKAATKKKGPQEVADLKPPPADFRAFLGNCVDSWVAGDTEGAAYAAAFATDVAVDGKGNTKPTAFHFTAANQTFLGAVEEVRASVTREWIEASLFKGNGDRPGSNLRWDPGAERNWALMADNPNEAGTRVDAPQEWLAFRGLPLLPSFPCGSRIITTGVVGRSEAMTFSWPLWSSAASLQTIRSVLQIDWKRQSMKDRLLRGVFAICSSSIKRSSQGFGNFGPSAVT